MLYFFSELLSVLRLTDDLFSLHSCEEYGLAGAQNQEDHFQMVLWRHMEAKSLYIPDDTSSILTIAH